MFNQSWSLFIYRRLNNPPETDSHLGRFYEGCVAPFSHELHPRHFHRRCWCRFQWCRRTPASSSKQINFVSLGVLMVLSTCRAQNDQWVDMSRLDWLEILEYYLLVQPSEKPWASLSRNITLCTTSSTVPKRLKGTDSWAPCCLEAWDLQMLGKMCEIVLKMFETVWWGLRRLLDVGRLNRFPVPLEKMNKLSSDWVIWVFCLEVSSVFTTFCGCHFCWQPLAWPDSASMNINEQQAEAV